MDCLEITGIRCYGYTGVFPEEQTLGQWFEVDLTLWTDFAAVGVSDALEDTLDYRQAIDCIQSLVYQSRFQTIERLATALSETILALPRISQVSVRLTKLHPPIPGFLGRVSVELVRSVSTPPNPDTQP